jgi:type I restriction enzyme S subunit
MSEWTETTLGDLILLQRGFDLTQKSTTPGPYPVISSGGVSYTTNVAMVKGPGVVTGRKGLLGKVYYSTGPYWPHDTTLWVKDFKGSDPRFVYYLLQTLPLASLDAGASNPTLNRNHAHLLPIRVPGPATQRRVSSILGAIDDLIENNRRRIELLDRMSQAIYREWFVRFRYPGHDGVAVVDSGLVPIPAGWHVKRLGTISSLDRTPIRPDRSPDEEFEHYSIPAFDAGQLPAVDLGKTIKSGKFLLTAAAVLVSKLNPRIERTWLVKPAADRRSVASTEFLILRPKAGLTLEFLYLLVKSPDFQERLQELSSGTSTSHQRAKPDDFLRIEVLAPAENLVVRLTDAVASELEMARTLRLENTRLTAVRSLLLPLLVTGQIDVSKLLTGDLVGAVE